MLAGKHKLGILVASGGVMNPIVEAHLGLLAEHIRLLEAVVTAPLGLYSDIKMLRESLPYEGTGDLGREELRERRALYGRMGDDPRRLALTALASVGASLDMLEAARDDAMAARLREGWIGRARMVAARATAQAAGSLRADTAARLRGLYVIVDPEATAGRDVREVAEAAMKGGASVVQYRDKTRDKGLTLATARELKALCDAYGALFIVNDDADVAAACGADGLHVGQTDLGVADARVALAATQIVGRSNNGVEEALESERQGADYLAVGAVYRTTTMGKSGRTAVGPDGVRAVKEVVSAPVVAIGGINAGNVGEVMRAGADCACVVSAVTEARDVAGAAARVVGAMGG